jgi:hypothetical protein
VKKKPQIILGKESGHEEGLVGHGRGIAERWEEDQRSVSRYIIDHQGNEKLIQSQLWSDLTP